MKHFLITFLVLLVGSAHAQSLGRLPGTVYPSDRGARTENTLLVVQNDLGTRGAEWYIDGNWVIDGNHFTFRSNDVVRMLPGSRFTVATGYTLGLGSAEFWAAREQCFYSTGGTITGGKYPHLFPEWGSLTAKGYLDSPYDYELITSTNDYTNLGGVGSLESAMNFMNTNWHTAAGYATTNQLNALTNQFNSLSNSLTNAVAVMSNQVSSSLASMMPTSNSIFFAAINNANQSVPNGTTDYLVQFQTEYVDTHSAFASHVFTVPTSGVYRISGLLTLTHADMTTGTGRAFLWVWVQGARFACLQESNDHQGGVNTTLGGSVVAYLTAGNTVALYENTDGTMTGNQVNSGTAFFSVQLLR